MTKKLEIPFYYEVKFKLISYDDQNNFTFNNYNKCFSNSNPIIAREEAFDACHEYIQNLTKNNRISKDELGNLIIDSPKFVLDDNKKALKNATKLPKPDLSNSIGAEEAFKKFSAYQDAFNTILEKTKNRYEEEVQINVVQNIKTVKNEILNDKIKYSIYIINNSSLLYTPQEDQMIANLEKELRLYDSLKLSTSEYRSFIEYYGYEHDSYEEDEEEYKPLNREILKTPHIWYSHKNYLTKQEKFLSVEKNNNSGDTIDGSEKFLDIIANGESNTVEFKPSLFYNFKTKKYDQGVKFIIAKTINSFLNANGGILFIGLNDNGTIQGLDYDYSITKGENKKDTLLKELDSLISWFLDVSLISFITTKFLELEKKDVLLVEVEPARKPTFAKMSYKKNKTKHFFVRMNAGSHELKDVEKIIEYVLNKNWCKGN